MCIRARLRCFRLRCVPLRMNGNPAGLAAHSARCIESACPPSGMLKEQGRQARRIMPISSVGAREARTVSLTLVSMPKYIE